MKKHLALQKSIKHKISEAGFKRLNLRKADLEKRNS